jgi:hypothetical protein
VGVNLTSRAISKFGIFVEMIASGPFLLSKLFG